MDEMMKFDPDSALVKEFMDFINSIALIVGFGKTIDIVESQAFSFYNQEDWRWKYAVFMCLSQLS